MCRRLGPDYVVAHGGEPAKYAALALPRGLPYVYLVIGSSHPRLKSRFRRALHRYYSRRASALGVVSAALAEEAEREHGIAPERIHVIPNGRDPNIYQPAASPQTSRRLQVIFVGRLDEQKRPAWFIDVIRQVRDRGVEAHAVMAGGGPLQDSLRDNAESAGVVLLGSRNDVPTLLVESDILLMTSCPPEGMPGVLIEAGLCGLAVVSTDVPGASDVVENGVTGLLVDVDDMPGLVHALHRLLVDHDLRRGMGSQARQRCLSRFSIDASVDRWEKLLGQLAS